MSVTARRGTSSRRTPTRSLVAPGPLHRARTAPAASRAYVEEVLGSPMWHGDGVFTRRAEQWLRERTGSRSAHLTPSCTHALELAAVLLDLGPGDEVVCPSFTFTSTATAIAIRGATPVFVDIRPDTLGIDVDAVAAALTERTRAVFVVHYGGVAADIDAAARPVRPRGVAVVEDNAHGLGATWRGRPLGLVRHVRHPELPRHQERHQRRGWRAARQ